MNLRPWFLLLASTGLLCADVTLPAIFSDHAVLQKAAKVPVWGKASPGEKVAVTLGEAKAETTTDAAGKWLTQLDLSKSGQGPYELIIEGKNKLTISDVLVGEVWVCSGQSNMEWKLGGLVSSQSEISQSANPRFRQFAVTKTTSETPLDDVTGSWQVASPETAKGFTAVGYYFGKVLEKDLQTPVGLLLSAWSGSQIEPWIPQEALATDPELAEGSQNAISKITAWPKQQADFLKAARNWETTFSRNDTASTAPPADAQWQAVTPETLPKEPGIGWYRITVPIDAAMAGKGLELVFRNLQGEDRIYWNGAQVAATAREATAGRSDRRYAIPGKQVTEGTGTLLVRVYNSFAAPVIPGEVLLGKATLPAAWEFAVERAFPLTAEAKAAMPVSPGISPGPSGTASFIYNAMIHPLVPYAIRGAIWYQGESNAGRAYQYRTSFRLLIEGWRKKWNQGDFPFYFCQLANFYDKTDQPGESDWAELREAQSLTTRLPNTGRAVLIDIGESGDIHPQNKTEVGRRLAQLALAETYDRKIPAHGPEFKSAAVEGDQIRVTFTHTDGGLVARPVPATYDISVKKGLTGPLKRNSPESQIEGFAICGADQKWVWAKASIDGDTILVSAPGVTQPVAVRYDWANNPNGNLANGAGFPASPFRSDDFPMGTRDTKYGIAPPPVAK